MYLAGSFLSAAIGCAASHQITAIVHPPETATILLDAAFTPEEAGLVTVGLDSWPARLSEKNIAIRYGVVNHYEAITSSAPSDWVFVIRESTMADLERDCHLGKNKVGCWMPSVRHIYIAADADEVTNEVLTGLAAHEFGHVLGLKDDEDTGHVRVMASTVDRMLPAPNGDDVVEFCHMHNCVF